MEKAEKAGSKMTGNTLKRIALILEGNEEYSSYIKNNDEAIANLEEQIREKNDREELSAQTMKYKTEARCEPKKEYRIDFKKLNVFLTEKKYNYGMLAEEIGQPENFFEEVREHSGLIKGSILNYICLLLETDYHSVLYVANEKAESEENAEAISEARLSKILSEVDALRKNNAKETGLIRSMISEENSEIIILKRKMNKVISIVSEINEMIKETVKELEKSGVIASGSKNKKDSDPGDKGK